jgi:predicted O-methyltransferase YrrM
MKCTDLSLFCELFASIASIESFKSVLEIGTYSGDFTRFLSALLPNGKIYTWDLPAQSCEESGIAAHQSGAATATKH